MLKGRFYSSRTNSNRPSCPEYSLTALLILNMYVLMHIDHRCTQNATWRVQCPLAVFSCAARMQINKHFHVQAPTSSQRPPWLPAFCSVGGMVGWQYGSMYMLAVASKMCWVEEFPAFGEAGSSLQCERPWMGPCLRSPGSWQAVFIQLSYNPCRTPWTPHMEGKPVPR